MKTPDIQKKLELIAMVTLGSVRKLSLEGKGLSHEELTADLSRNGELVAALDRSTGSDKFQKDEMLRLKKELDKLNLQYKKTSGHRRELAAQLDAAENESTHSIAFIQRAIPGLIQLVRAGGNKQLHDSLDRIKTLVKKSAPLDQLEDAFQQLKDIAFKTELKKPGKKPSPEKSSLWGLFRQKAPDGQSEALVHFKETYQTIVEELRLNLDQTALGELTGIEGRLQGILQLDDFFVIRDDVLVLLKNYISRISTERKEAAKFILEIGKRLVDVEHHLLQSLTVAQESQNARTRFTDTIEKEMAVFQEAVDFSQSLEDLKSKVVASLSAIKKAIDNSRLDESSRHTKSDKQVAVLKKNLDRLKGEIKSARKRSETLEVELLSDPLTRAFNRRAYDQRIEDELKRHHRYKTVFSMLLLDVDHFKQINDKYGHSVGDLCLKEIINRIKPLLRETDFLARFGGEEFVIILPETGYDGTAEVAEKIRVHIEKTDFLHKGEHVNVTISLGGTEAHFSDKNGEKIFERVDKAMYQAKQSGRNRVVMISASESP